MLTLDHKKHANAAGGGSKLIRLQFIKHTSQRSLRSEHYPGTFESQYLDATTVHSVFFCSLPVAGHADRRWSGDGDGVLGRGDLGDDLGRR